MEEVKVGVGDEADGLLSTHVLQIDVLLECARACFQGSEHLDERRLVFNSPSGSMLSTRTQHAPSPARGKLQLPLCEIGFLIDD